MGCADNYFKPGPCSFCGKKHGGVLGKSAWGFENPVCSDECGNKLAATIKENEASQDFADAAQEARLATERMHLIRRRGLPHLPLF